MVSGFKDVPKDENEGEYIDSERNRKFREIFLRP